MEQTPSKAITPITNEQEYVKEVAVTDKYSTSKANFGSLIRLVVGGVALGYEELMIRLNDWESLISHQLYFSEGNNSDTSVAINQKQVIFLDNETQNLKENDRLKFAVFGLLFESQEKAINGLKAVDNGSRKFMHATRPIVKPITSNRLLKPLMKRYDRLAQRGQDEVNRWVNSGKLEYQHSYHLAKTAYQSTINEAINELADNPEIQNLIETQSLSLANEVIEETRERSVTADDFVEGFLRALLRKPLRSELPPPPSEVREKAVKILIPK